MKRCDWAEKNELEMEHHDNEWGVPLVDDRALNAYFRKCTSWFKLGNNP